MGEVAARYMATRRKPEKPVPAGEAKALERIQDEAAANGATLHSNGKGGLPSSTVLGIYRRDGWHCHKCGGKDDLTIHHKADVLASPYLRRLHQIAGRTDQRNLATICHKCHDAIHQEARAAGEEAPE